jgi:hypothetical protein
VGDEQLVGADGHGIARRELATAPALTLAVHEHAAPGEQGLGVAAAVCDPCELQQLAQPDARAPDRDLAAHAGEVSRRLARRLRERRGADLTGAGGS